MLVLYGELLKAWPSPVVALNRVAAVAAYRQALELAENEAERAFLAGRISECGG